MLHTFIFLFLLFISFSLTAMPKISVNKRVDANGFTQVKVHNKTREALACYVAIDGHKTRFVLTARNSSLWYKGTSKKHKHTDFKTWCDYLKYHTHYEAYRQTY